MPNTPSPPPGGLTTIDRPPRWVLLSLLALTALAAGLRFLGLADLPPGFHVDEAYNVLDARAVLAGWRPVFLPDNAGREVLYTYLQAALLGLLGDRLEVARAASALAGSLTVAAAGWWAWVFPGRAGFPGDDEATTRRRRGRLAVLVAAFTALSYWHLHFSRFGIRAVLFPLLVTLALGLWWQLAGPDRGPGLAGGLGGKVRLAGLALVLGLAVYAHPAGRALALLPAMDAAWSWWRGERRPARILVLALAGAVIVALPITLFWYQHPWLFGSHAGEVSLAALAARDFGGRLGAALAYNALAVAGMFNLAGDPAPWRNLPGRPVFEALSGLLFLAGLVLTARALKSGARWPVLALAWLAILLAPALLSDAAPSFSRAIGIIPVVFLFPALALDEVLARFEAGGRRGLVLATAVLVLALYGAASLRDYFLVWAQAPATALAFDADKVAVAEALAVEAAAGRQPYLSFDAARHATLRALSRDAARGFDAGRGLVLPPAEEAEAIYAFRLPAEAAAMAELEATLGPALALARTESLPLPMACPAGADCPAESLTLLRLDNTALRAALLTQPAEAPDLARFGPYIALREARFPDRVRPGETLTLTLVWQGLQPTDRYLNTLIHLDGVDAQGQPVGLANADGPPLLRREVGESSYPSQRWRPGETLIALHRLTIDPEAPPGPAELLVGWYDPNQPALRLEVLGDGSGHREEGTVWQVGRIEVLPPQGGSGR